MSYQKLVREFQTTSDQRVSDKPSKLSQKEFLFREELLREETNELIEAFELGDRVEMMDGLCDIKYVNDGTANMIGFKQNDNQYRKDYNQYSIIKETKDLLNILTLTNPDSVDVINKLVHQLSFQLGFSYDQLQEGLKRVHESNMSKFCLNQYEAIETMNKYKLKDTKCHIKIIGDKYVVFRYPDNKVLKSINYHPVDLTDLV